MNASKTLFLLIFLQVGLTYGQFNPERLAYNKIRKGEWASAIKILNKSIKKDSLNMEATYLCSVLFFNSKYSQFNIDSAHFFYQKTQRLYQATDQRTKERLKKFPLDSTILERVKTQLDSAAFEKAKEANTEMSYIHFLTYYADASQKLSATELRDEAAFVTALKQNTHQSFGAFLEKYPAGHRSAEAKQRFDKLLFEANTRNKTVHEYQYFVSQYPSSPYSSIAIKNIFEMTTEDGMEKSFQDFIRQYPNSSQALLASHILTHLKISNQSGFELTDSLKEIYPLREWMPFSENGKWGFMDETGKVTHPPTLPGVAEKYFCSPLTLDFIHTPTAIVARNGHLIFTGNFNIVNELGAGYMRAMTDSSLQIIHKGGWALPHRGLTEANLIGNRFIVSKNSKAWGLIALNGKTILPFIFDKIIEQGKFVILSKSGKETLVEINNIIPFAGGSLAPLVADEIRAFGEKYFWVRNGSLEKVLDQNLKEVIPFDRHIISLSPAGLIIKKNSSIYVKDWPALEGKSLTTWQIFEPWLITAEAGEKPSLFYIPTKKEVASSTDSIWFDQSFAAVKTNDSIKLWQSDQRYFSLPVGDNYSIRQSKDSVVFILVSSKTKTTVLRASDLKKLFTAPFTGVEPVLKNIFLLRENGRQGLINSKGQIILKPAYDAILFSNGIFSLLMKRKFGSYNPQTKKLLKPLFDANLTKYGSWLIGRKGNQWGFLQADGKDQTPFKFDEIIFWSDTLALVTQSGKRALYSITRRKNVVENITSFQTLEGDHNEKLALWRQPSGYGLVGSQTGIIIKPEFEEISHQLVNGSLILIGLKPIENGKVHVIYFQSSGKIIRSQIMPKAIAYTLLCDD